ncbi:MAG TPA: hypothetical protein VFU27_16030 [Terriglobales bacterium]|nr:hypothetical protein [Terriglobales bacterium]
MLAIFCLPEVLGGPSAPGLPPWGPGDPLQQFLNHPLVRLLNDPLVWGPVGGALGIYLFVRGFLLLKRKRLLINTPRSSVRAAALGPVEVSGQATGPYTLVSPLSLTDCYYYRVATTSVTYKQNRHRLMEESAPLYLDDGTGKLLVDPFGVEIQCPPTATWQSKTLPEYLRHFLVQHGMSLDTVATVNEFCIRPGDRIVVFGTLQENPWGGSTGAHSKDAAERVGPGFLSEVAADVQRRRAFESLDAAAPSGASPAAASDFNLHPPVILGKASGPFFISQGSARELTGSLAWRAPLYIWGGPAMALISIYSLLRRLWMI